MKNRPSAIPKWPKKNLNSFTEPGFSRRGRAVNRFGIGRFSVLPVSRAIHRARLMR